MATWHLGIWENELYEPSALVADFSSNFEAFYCPGDTLKFVPHSVASAGATYQWSFPGGSPASSTQMFPATTYSAAGSYDITLIVTDGANSDTITKAAFITNIASGTIPLLKDLNRAPLLQTGNSRTTIKPILLECNWWCWWIWNQQLHWNTTIIIMTHRELTMLYGPLNMILQICRRQNCFSMLPTYHTALHTVTHWRFWYQQIVGLRLHPCI
ncbi:MAG: PKD domain-containing protein [Bacteroidetes bacterium]|nr:PKD domain-containing protein [Bacteroidota bacterium]